MVNLSKRALGDRFAVRLDARPLGLLLDANDSFLDHVRAALRGYVVAIAYVLGGQLGTVADRIDVALMATNKRRSIGSRSRCRHRCRRVGARCAATRCSGP